VENFNYKQTRDACFIPPPTTIALTYISTTECNPEKNIITNTNTIITQSDLTHLYLNTGTHLTIIPTTRLQWLWKQYHTALHTTHDLVPPTQLFETKIIWLYQRYKYNKSNKTPLRTPQHTLPQNILQSLTTTFNISHSYFSSPITCSIQITQFYSPFERDKIFGSLGKAFAYKWKGIGFAHPHNEEMAQQAIHWARLAAKHDPSTITILVILDIIWYQNFSPYTGPFKDTHVIAHFAAATITYEEPTIPPELNKHPCTETLAIHILYFYVHTTKIIMSVHLTK